MTNEQRTQAWVLLGVPGIRAMLKDLPHLGADVLETLALGQETRRVVMPNLADETGVVEGVLHRVLERLVGEPVHLAPVWGDGLAGWMAERAHSRLRLHGEIHHPTRIGAIVAALLAQEGVSADTPTLP